MYTKAVATFTTGRIAKQREFHRWKTVDDGFHDSWAAVGSPTDSSRFKRFVAVPPCLDREPRLSLHRVHPERVRFDAPDPVMRQEGILASGWASISFRG